MRLLSRVQRPPERPFPGGADDQEIADLERRLGVPLPDSLVDWLRSCKGEAICAGGVLGARPDDESLDMATCLAMFPTWRDSGWLPVAGDGCGNYFVLVTSGELAGQVGFIDTIADPGSIESMEGRSLWVFLRRLLSQDG
ncbi:SMI1 / KNR4 family (SUKH-1) [Actinoplanes philippinensis]|uniref:SMI1 / KNR4 family (SUKH-1) n=1 Tax=Actinoplanes philippinensis TaxID=35752 RepID=A0A1I2MF62_9ACTN|nr:SMI1 / KNR4 family (SUKH-1) [Actinoplanes philippinensis]